MIQETSSLYIGTAGWSYPHWNGVVYPTSASSGESPPGAGVQTFRLVEINSSFYQFLKPELVKLWIKKVSDHPSFLFTAKLQPALYPYAPCWRTPRSGSSKKACGRC